MKLLMTPNWLIACMMLLAGAGCSDDSSDPVSAAAGPDPAVLAVIELPDRNQRKALAKQIVGAAQGNGAGVISHPLAADQLSGNIFISVDARDDDGISSVGVSFNDDDQLLFFCQSQCGNELHKTITGINPLIYNATSGTLTLNLWVLDNLDNLMLVDSQTVEWQERRLSGVTIVRPEASTNLTVNWTTESDILRYNLYLATEPDVNIETFSRLNQGQALLAVEGPPQSFSRLDPAQQYYLIISGVDGGGESTFSSEVRVAVSSGQQNIPPETTDDNFETDEDNGVTGNLLLNDSDSNDDLLSVSPRPIRRPEFGRLELKRNGEFNYIPDDNYNGPDSFIYEVQDGQGEFSQSTVVLTVLPVNDPPQAIDDSYATATGQALVVSSAAGVMANDSDIDGDAISVSPTLISDVSHGSLELASDGSFSYQPEPEFIGSDGFVYQLVDSQGAVAQATVSINVGSANTPPVATNDVYTVDEDVTLRVDGVELLSILANDSDPDGDTINLLPQLLTAVQFGTLTLDTQGLFTYVPGINFNGSDQFIYAIEDGRGGLAQATVTIIVAPQNDPPVANDDSYSVIINTSLIISAGGLLDNDIDIDNDSLTINTTAVTAPANGILELGTDGSFQYVPNNNFVGSDSFVYQLIDGSNSTSQATVTINVTTTSNQPPVANADGYIVSQDIDLVVTGVNSLLFNDTDPENDPLTVNTTPISNVSNGFLELSSDGSFIYLPNSGFSGSDSFVYQISDGTSTAQATVTITVITTTNQPPVARPDRYLATTNTTLQVAAPGLLDNDTDVNNDPLAVFTTPIADPLKGSVTLSSDGSFDYVPIPGVVGIDGFVYLMSDIAAQTSFALSTVATSYVYWLEPIAGNPIANIPVIPNNDLYSSFFDGHNHVVAGSKLIMKSKDNVSWQKSYHDNISSFKSIATDNIIPITTNLAVGMLNSVFIQQTDGTNESHWLQIPNSLGVTLNDVFFNGSRFIATGQGLVAFFDKNTLTWGSIATNNAVQYNGIVEDMGKIIIVGDGGSIETSDDNGLTWVTRVSNVSDNLNKIISTGLRFVAVGETGSIVTSSDGITWILRDSTTTALLYDVAWNGSILVAGGDGGEISVLRTSPDGITWSTPDFSTAPILGIDWHGSQFMLVGWNGTIVTSADGNTFTELVGGSPGTITGIAHNGVNTLVRVADFASVIEVSTDNGNSWTALTSVGLHALKEVNYYNGLFIAVGTNGLLMTSPDGTNWTTRTTPVTTTLNDVFHHVVPGPVDLYIAVGSNDTIIVSNDAISWTQEFISPTPNSTEQLNAVTHDGANFVAVGSNGRIITRDNTDSPGATDWSDSFTNSGFGSLGDIDWDGTKLFIVSGSGGLVTGDSTSSFTEQVTPPFALSMNAISYDFSSQHFIAVGPQGLVYDSSDGINWQLNMFGTDVRLNDVIYASGAIPVIFTVGDGVLMAGKVP